MRKENIRNAFNSPMRPFVLATTSIGQEGLDFHNYCRVIMHWNLPSNPHRCRTDFADIQNKKECGGNRQWQNHYLRNWAANTKGKGII